MADYRIWMPLKCGDFMRATSDFTAEECGAYILLLNQYWQHGPLPNDDRALARIARVSPHAWRVALADRVLREFELVDHAGTELWHLPRLDAELERASKIADSTHKRASRAAILRWRGPPKNDA